jgi:preprotein translocase subunit SecY
VVLPGIDPKALTALQEQTRGGLMALLDMFSGGAFSNASIFALGIMPYISASIVMQLLAIAVLLSRKCNVKARVDEKNQSIHSLSYYCNIIVTRSDLSYKFKCTIKSSRSVFTHWNLVYSILNDNYGCGEYVLFYG